MIQRSLSFASTNRELKVQETNPPPLLGDRLRQHTARGPVKIMSVGVELQPTLSVPGVLIRKCSLESAVKANLVHSTDCGKILPAEGLCRIQLLPGLPTLCRAGGLHFMDFTHNVRRR